MGYRRIASHLNELGIKTPKGNLWGGNNVHSVLKRNRERLRRLEIQTEESVDYKYGYEGSLTYNKNGKREGLWEFFNEDGSLRFTETWKNGVLQ